MKMTLYALAGDYTFRLHCDYGLGSFIGVDGSTYTPGDTFGHVNVDGTGPAMDERVISCMPLFSTRDYICIFKSRTDCREMTC